MQPLLACLGAATVAACGRLPTVLALLAFLLSLDPFSAPFADLLLVAAFPPPSMTVAPPCETEVLVFCSGQIALNAINGGRLGCYADTAEILQNGCR